MTVFRTLVSGSSGNAVVFSENGTNILIDCGVSGKCIAALLNEAGIAPERLNCILVTHEHIDHTNGVGVLSRKYNIPVVASVGTWHGMSIGKIQEHNMVMFSDFRDIYFGDAAITPFEIPHDANMPTGYIIKCGSKKYAIATDIGHITPIVQNAIKGCNAVLLEANYDADMLESGSYPYALKQRISGDFGHLCNSETAKLAAHLVKNGTDRLILGHLSNENNTSELAFHTVATNFEYEGIKLGKDVLMTVAPRYNLSINVG